MGLILPTAIQEFQTLDRLVTKPREILVVTRLRRFGLYIFLKVVDPISYLLKLGILACFLPELHLNVSTLSRRRVKINKRKTELVLTHFGFPVLSSILVATV